MRSRRAFRLAVVLVPALLAAACLGRQPKPGAPPDQIYKLAREAMDVYDYDTAQKLINRLRDEYPFSKHALESELLTADIAYKRGNYEEAAAAYRSFEELHPTNPQVPYAIYRRGLAYMELSHPADRDQTATRKAAEALEKLLNAHPDSQYAKDARKQLTEARNRLAAHEIYVARYYARKEKYDAALSRLHGMIRSYPDSLHRDEALKLALQIESKKRDDSKSN